MAILTVWQALGWGTAVACLLEGGRTRRWRWVVAAIVLMGISWPWPVPSQTAPALAPAWPSPPVGGVQGNPQELALVPPLVAIRPLPTPLAEHPPSQTLVADTPLAPPQLHIPRLGLQTAVAPVPIRGEVWDVSQLGGGVGWLEGLSRQVLVGHMTFPWLGLLQEGAFAHLEGMRLGDVVEYGGLRYEVVAVGRLPADGVAQLLQAEPTALLLLTCTDWNFETWQYDNRLVVTAVPVAEP